MGKAEWIGKEESIDVTADDITNAIVEVKSIKVQNAIIKGNLDIRKIEDRLGRDNDAQIIILGNISILSSEIRGFANFSGATFSGNVDFRDATFSENAFFSDTIFSGYANFSAATFSKDAGFSGTIFSGNADFSDATFSGYADFNGITFGGDVYFNFATFSENADFKAVTFSGSTDFKGATMKYPADFIGINFRENTVITGLWNNILCPLFLSIVWLLTFGRVKKLPKRTVTDFLGFNTTTIMDGSSNPYLKRYIDDEQWIKSWRYRSWWRRFLFIIWELTSHCGRSFGLWLFWSFLLAIVFGFLYKGHIEIDSVENWYSPFYFSVVTFTTLGFGDVTPKDGLGQLLITLEVVIGYIMLGGLISIFANKLARRS